MAAVFVPGHVEKAKEFLARSKTYLEQGDLHQASEKGWGAAAHIAKAVAEANGWTYERHDQFDGVIYDASDLYGQPELENLGNAAHFLHRSYYLHPSLLRQDRIKANLDRVETMVAILAPILVE